MSDKTYLAIPGRKVPVPRPFKRLLQIAIAVALTASAVFVLMAGNGLLQPKGTLAKIIPMWMAFVSRNDILATMILTAMVTVFFVYWQRETERR